VRLAALTSACLLCACGSDRALVVAPSGEARLSVAIRRARTAEERRAGLSAIPPLGPDEGLLLELPQASTACITNAPVSYGVDAVYARADSVVVAVETFAAGEADARCHDAVLQILEVRAGAASLVRPGDRLVAP
jgi:uncharacterized membrane protein (UPF0127 family)